MDRTRVVHTAMQADKQFLNELGALTLHWSDLERVLFALLKHYAGVSDNVGRALFSGARAKAMMGFITAIADNTNLDKSKRSDLEHVFSQVAVINTMRDFIVHNVNGNEIEYEEEKPDERLITNATRVSRLKNAQYMYVGHEHLQAMRQDLIRCCWRLQAHCQDPGMPIRFSMPPEDLNVPWAFVPPQPVRKKA